VKVSEVKKVIANYLERMNYLSQELEMKETVIIGLKAQIDDLNRSSRVYEGESYVAQTELSKSLYRFAESDKRMGELHMQLIKLTELKAMYESIIDKKEEVINTLIRKLELTGEPKLDRLRAEIKDDLEFYKNILPEKVETIIEPKIPTITPTQPGEVIKK